MPCIDANGCASFGSLSHHPVVEMTNNKNIRFLKKLYKKRGKMHKDISKKNYIYIIFIF
jgi:hypothetical protein